MLAVDRNHFLKLNWLSHAGVRHTYGVAVVALAFFCVGLSFQPLAAVRAVCEATVSRGTKSPLDAPPQRLSEALNLDALQNWLTSAATLQQVKKGVAPVQARQLQLFPDSRDPESLVVRVEYPDLSTAQTLAAYLADGLADEMQRRQATADQAERQRLTHEVHAARSIVAAVEQESQGLLFAMRSEIAHLEAARQQGKSLEASSILAGPTPVPPPALNPQWQMLQNEIESLEAQVQQLRTKYTSEHPLLQVAENQLQVLHERRQELPQYLRAFGSQPAINIPATFPQTEWEPTGPVARYNGVQRTSVEVPTPAEPVVQQYLAELASCSTELAAARQVEQRAVAALQAWEIRTATQASALQVSDVQVVEQVRQLRRDSVIFAIVLAVVGGGGTVLLGIQWSAPLQRSGDLAQRLGMPVVSVVHSRSITTAQTTDSTSQNWQRYLINGAEFVLGAFVAAYVVSSLVDPAFADLVGRDPLAAIPELWRR